MTGRIRFLVMVLTLSGMLLMIVGLVNHTTMESGGIEQFMYPFSSFMAAIGGSILVTAGLSYLTFARHPVEKPSWLDDLSGLLDHLRMSAPASAEPVSSDNAIPTEPVVAKETVYLEGGEPPVQELVLRLLSGDERLMFRTLVDAGGEAYQKDLVLRTKWSDTKVSRTIDRLVEKGLVSRERRGMSNMIRITISMSEGAIFQL